MVFEALDRRGLPHAVLTSESVRHVSFLPKQLVDLLVKTMVKARIPLCARDIRKRCEELACPAEDDGLVDEPVDERVDEPVDEGVMNRLNSKKGSNLNRTCTLLISC